MCERSIRTAGLVNDSITDGPGLRFTLFVQGCVRRCEGCHNQSALPFEGGIAYTVDQIMRKIDANPMLCGVTLSGGEPFAHAASLLPLARRVKQAGHELAAYTGYTFEELLALEDESVHALLALCDVIVDGPFVLAERDLSLKFRGSKNQRVLNVAHSLSRGLAVWETDERWV